MPRPALQLHNRLQERRLRPLHARLLIWPLTEQAAEAYGWIAADLGRTGRPVGKIDMLIAAIAVSLGKTTVVSGDGDLNSGPRANRRERVYGER